MMSLLLAAALATNVTLADRAQANTVYIGAIATQRDYRHPLYALPGQRMTWFRRLVHNAFLEEYPYISPDTKPVHIELGAGVLLPDHRVLTAAHVVLGIRPFSRDDRYTVRLHNGPTVEATVQGISPFADIAILQLIDPPALPPPLPVAKHDPQQRGEVLFVGFPMDGQPWQIGRGRIDGFRLDETFTAPVSPSPAWFIRGRVTGGNSGGPVLNDQGAIIGIVSRQGWVKDAFIAEPASTGITEIDQAREQGRAGLRCLNPEERPL